jgi:hypothetical protein
MRGKGRYRKHQVRRLRSHVPGPMRRARGSVPSSTVITKIRAGWQEVDDDLRPLYRAIEPIVVFSVAAAAIVLQVLIPDSIAPADRYLLPSIEGVALVALIVVTELQRRGVFQRNVARKISILLIVVMAGATAWALGRVLDELLRGHVHNGRQLIFAGAKLWGTLIIVFALVYWELDRGGPSARNKDAAAAKHLWFPQDDNTKAMDGRKWAPTFFDYFYVSLTNATAFSPTDTMPLTHTAKLFMGVQCLLSLATVGLVTARAINIL